MLSQATGKINIEAILSQKDYGMGTMLTLESQYD